MKSLEMTGGDHAVLLLHGLQGLPAEMLPVAKRLHQSGYTVRVPHIRGYGHFAGDTARSVTPWQAWHRQALDAFHDLKRSYRTVSLCGLCIGAVLALSLAAETGDEVSSLSLLSTTLFYDGWSIPWYRFLLPLGYYTPFRFIYSYRERAPFGLKNPQLRRWIAREMADNASSIAGASRLTLPAIHEAELLIKSVKPRMAQVTAPALVIHAREDDVSSLRSADYVAEHIGSAELERLVLHDSYHMITLDNERATVAEETRRFFDRCIIQTGSPDPLPAEADRLSSTVRANLVQVPA